MKLRNKKTGEMCELKVTVNGDLTITKDDEITGIYPSLAELNEEWEDYEEDKFYYAITGVKADNGVTKIKNKHNDMTAFDKSIGNYFETKEEAEKAVEKLKAWKRLKDKGYYFKGWRLDKLHFEIELRVKEYDFMTDELKQDLDLLFGSEIKDQ